MARKKKTAAKPAHRQPREFERVRFGARRGKYHTSTGPAWPGMEVALPWMEALVFIDRGDAEALTDAD